MVLGGADRAQPVCALSRPVAAPEPDRADRDALVDVLKEQNEYLSEQLRREQAYRSAPGRRRAAG